MGSVPLDMRLLRHQHLETRPVSGRRVDSELAANRLHALPNNSGSAVPLLQVAYAEPALEGEAAAVVGDFDFPLAVLRGKPNRHVGRGAVLADIDQALLHDANELEADAPWHPHLGQVGQELSGNARIAAEPLHH